MRRDYFTCVFLACICASLFFCCFLPLYFTYGLIVPREFGTPEKVFSILFASSVLVIIPVYAAYRKKFWITAGLAVYGILAMLPMWILPRMAEKLAAEDVNILTVVEGFILKAIYGMVEAPFASLSTFLGDEFAASLPFKILPVSLIIYVAFQVFRFYRNAYLAEQMDPASVMDNTARENVAPTGEKPQPEVLGTVISAPVRNPRPEHVRRPAPAESRPATEKKENVIELPSRMDRGNS